MFLLDKELHNMRALERYIDTQNLFVSNPDELFNIRNLSDNNIKDLREIIAADLSPENLYGDGELSASVVSNKLSFLTAVEAELSDISSKRIQSIFNAPANDSGIDIAIKLKDWNADENGHDALYDVNISRINNSPSFEVSITAEGQPSLSVCFELMSAHSPS